MKYQLCLHPHLKTCMATNKIGHGCCAPWSQCRQATKCRKSAFTRSNAHSCNLHRSKELGGPTNTRTHNADRLPSLDVFCWKKETNTCVWVSYFPFYWQHMLQKKGINLCNQAFPGHWVDLGCEGTNEIHCVSVENRATNILLSHPNSYTGWLIVQLIDIMFN